MPHVLPSSRPLLSLTNLVHRPAPTEHLLVEPPKQPVRLPPPSTRLATVRRGTSRTKFMFRTGTAQAPFLVPRRASRPQRWDFPVVRYRIRSALVGSPP